jgi:hypothetical protein
MIRKLPVVLCGPRLSALIFIADGTRRLATVTFDLRLSSLDGKYAGSMKCAQR